MPSALPHRLSVIDKISRLVLSTLNEALEAGPDRKCFRLVGGVLVERTVKDVVPALETNRSGVRPTLDFYQFRSLTDAIATP